MPELGKRVGVNKSTIQRYEADGVDPKRTMIINGLAEALLTTPEWLTGLSEDKEYDSHTLCAKDMEMHALYRIYFRGSCRDIDCPRSYPKNHPRKDRG